VLEGTQVDSADLHATKECSNKDCSNR
jgi:hypothetical protein